MPFWSKGNNSSGQATKDFTSSDEASFTHTDTMPSSSASGPSAPGGMAEMQQFAAAIQQQIIIQSTISDLADRSFAKCITKPSDSLSSKESACVKAVLNKWMDTNQFMTKRMQKKMQSQNTEQMF